MKLSQRRLARPSLGGLLATRQGSLMLALVCAVCAAGVLMFALGRYKSNLKTTVQQATVLVSTGEIKKGTPGETIAAQNLYKSTPVAVTQLSPGAIGNAAQLAGETAQADILPGQQLVAGDFAAVVGITGTLAPDQRAIAVSVDEVHGITDALQAGDRVDVYLDLGGTAAGTSAAGNTGPGSSAAGSGSTSGTGAGSLSGAIILLASNVDVIKPPGGLPVRVGGTPITGGTLLLAVNTKQVAQFQWANDNAKMYLALRPTDNATKSSATPVTASSLVRATLKTNDPSALKGATPSTTGATP